MLWLKRNLVLVIAIAVVLVLTGAGGVYAWTKKGYNDELTSKVETQKADLDSLTKNLSLTATPENVRRAQSDLDKAQKYTESCRKFFVPTLVTILDDRSKKSAQDVDRAFKSLLDMRIGELRRSATNAGVDIPPGYSFSFEPEMKHIQFDAGSVKPLAQQLQEVTEICEALFGAPIHSLGSLRRVAVCQYDRGANDTMGEVTTVSNRATGLLCWPYEVTFDCFSQELAAVMERLSRVPRVLVVKTVKVDALGVINIPWELINTPPAAAPSPVQPVRPGVRGAARPAPKANQGLWTVLDDRMLRVQMQLQVIKPEK